jgi:hypothetical protein
MGYWCLKCLRLSIDANASAPDLRIARSCSMHKAARAIKFCPCDNKWAYCRACLVSRKDPRAGTALCHRCLLPRGTSTNCCRCSSLLSQAPAELAAGSARRRLAALASPKALTDAAPVDLLGPAQGLDYVDAGAPLSTDAAVAFELLGDPTMMRIAAADYIERSIQD